MYFRRITEAFFAMGVLAVFNSYAFATEVSKDYRFTSDPFKGLDALCVQAFLNKVAPQFDGLRSARLQSPHFATLSNGRTTLLTYPSVSFRSQFGNARGALVCVIEGRSGRKGTVSVAFEGRGLAGFRKHPLARTLKEPKQQITSGYSTDLK